MIPMAQFQSRNPDYAERVRARLDKPLTRDFFGIEVVSIEPGKVQLGLDVRPELGHAPGWFQGSITTAIAEFAGGLAAISLVAPDWDILTLDQTIKFVGPARGQRLVARAEVIRPGKTITTCHCEVYVIEDGIERLCAVMLQTNHAAPLPPKN
jgi:uncharacterized protein (TIGR00369 family)